MKEKEHLFSKILNDLSTGQLKELCGGIDNSFMAALRPLRGKVQTENQEEYMLVVTKIDELQQENLKLTCELNKWKDTAAIESESRRVAESEIRKLKDTIERVQIDNHKLAQYGN